MNARVDRREFLQGSTALVVAVALPAGWTSEATAAGAAPVGPVTLTPYLRLGADGRATLSSPTTEMGQGTHTGHALVVADELGLPVDRIDVVVPEPADPFRRGPASGPKSMGSGGSWGMRAWFQPLRVAAAQAREMLIAAGAVRLGVDAAQLDTRDGAVVHAASGRKVPFTALLAEAGRMTPPAAPKLRDRSALSLIGRGAPRLDSRAKATGGTVYSADFRVPGMLYACGRMSPVFKAEPERWEAVAAKRLPGVLDVVAVPGGVAVVARTQWAAMKGAEALEITWSKKPIADVDSSTIDAAMRDGLGATDATVAVAKAAPNYDEVVARAARTIEADYVVPYLAHAPMEPWSCTVRPNADGSLEIWGPFQAQDRALTTAATLAKVPPEKVHLRTLPLGGGFGRRLMDDGVPPAVTVALAVKQPVKFFWTREDEFARGFYRPAQAARLKASVDAAGRIVAMHVRVTGPSLRGESAAGIKPGEIDPASVSHMGDARYRFDAHKIDYALRHFPIPVAPWRSVGATHNAFFVECFLDEVAVATNRDPVALRRELLAHDARALKVVDTVAEAAGWGTPLPAGVERGFAYFESYGSLCAHAVEVEKRNDRPFVRRVVVALDCGEVILPDQARAQVEGGVIQGLSTALHEAVTIERGAAVQRNFDRYTLLRIDEAPPKIEVYFVRSGEALGGVGEPGLPPITPAVANAWSRLTGTRVRELPILKG
jgi:isoquinoline 1-oxidoreductase beta subunit